MTGTNRIGKRQLIARGLCATGLPYAVRLMRLKRISVLNYHRILEDNVDLESLPFDSDVFSCTKSEFQGQIEKLQTYGDILSFDEFKYLLDKKKSPKRHSVLITFDDGYVDNYEIAYPILKANDASACFFIPTKPVSDRKLGWWDIISYIVKSCSKSSISMNSQLEFTYDLKHENRADITRRIIARVKLAEGLNMEEFLDELSMTCGVDVPSDDVQSRELMSVENMLAMREAGMEIGGHGHSHQVLGRVSESRQEKDIAICTEILNSWLHGSIRAFAYPVGDTGSYSDATKSFVSRHGYEMAFNFRENAKSVNLNSADKYDLDRLAIYRPTDSQFKLLAHGINI